MKKNKHHEKAWVVSVRMGLGHQRAAFALAHLAGDGVLNVGEPVTCEPDELKLWHNITNGYETISRMKNVPIIGNGLFNLMNALLYIPPFYPIRDLSKPNMQAKFIRGYLEKGMGKKLMEIVETRPLPMISTYFVPSLIADFYNYSRNYCVVTDAEINRAWVPVDPTASKTIYLAPCSRAMNRLKEYGVRDDKIFLTGFPIPRELLGSEKLEILLPDLGQRLRQLDPENRFWPLHGSSVEHFIGHRNVRQKMKRPLTILYAVGGAGALWETGLAAVKSLKKQIMRKELRFALAPGVRPEIYNKYVEGLHELRIPRELVPIIYSPDTVNYFELFTRFIRETDILWTKPSELVFYSALGLPIIMTEPVGAQEEYNKKWLLEIQAGMSQEDPAYANEWLLDLLHFGRFAESAWDGFLKARKFGIYKIEEILRTGTMIRESSPLRR
ncbi:MAG: hypothetical protein JW904_13015 [Spirochaetales bacterium]|nr:hypothetical protein [Spirochaetales bacterium]